MGAVAWAIRQRSVSHPTGSPEAVARPRLPRNVACGFFSKAHQKSGPFSQPALPGFDGHTTPSDSRHGRRLRDVEAATLALDGAPPLFRTTFPTCRAHY